MYYALGYLSHNVLLTCQCAGPTRAGLARLAASGRIDFCAGLVPDAFAVFLVDPVDCPCFAPCSSNCYPSGLAAVAAAGKPVAVAGASVKGCCNPRGDSDCTWACQLGCRAATGNGTCTGFDYQVQLPTRGSSNACASLTRATSRLLCLWGKAMSFCMCRRVDAGMCCSPKCGRLYCSILH